MSKDPNKQNPQNHSNYLSKSGLEKIFNKFGKFKLNNL